MATPAEVESAGRAFGERTSTATSGPMSWVGLWVSIPPSAVHSRAPNLSAKAHASQIAGTDSRVDRPCTYRAVYPRRCLELVPGLKPRPCRLQGGCTVSRARPASLALRGGIEPPTSPLPKVRSTY